MKALFCGDTRVQTPSSAYSEDSFCEQSTNIASSTETQNRLETTRRLKDIALNTTQTMGPEDICRLSEVFVHTREITNKWAEIAVRMIICVNRPLREQIRQNRYYELQEAVERLKRGSAIKKGLKKYIREDKKEIDYQAVKEGEKYDGIYIIITTTDLPTEKVVQKYFDRDMIEKSFRSLKSTLRTVPLTKEQEKIYKALHLLS